MAGDWIKMRIDLQSHPKIVRILSATGSDKFRAIGGLHAVWSVFDTHSVDGILPGYTPQALDHVIGWDGFSGAMIAVGWLIERQGEGLVMPEFDEHNGKSAKRRAEDQKRKRDERSRPHSVRNLSENYEDENRTREEIEIEKKEELIPPLSPKVEKPKRNSKIPDPFLLTADMRAWAVEKAPGVDIRAETENFVDYWRGAGKTKADWVATWRTWMRKAQQDCRRRGLRGSAFVDRQQQIEEANARVVREMYERDELRRQREQGEMSMGLGDVVAVDGEVIRVN